MKQIIAISRDIVLVDDEDYEELDKYNWHIKYDNNSVYAVRSTSKEEREVGYPQKIRMHRQIIGAITNKDVLVDHKDTNGLNNQRNNLRVATRQQNAANTSNKTGDSSIYKGVTMHQKGFMARIGYNNKIIYLGYFTNEIDAARAYNAKAVELYGEFAFLNKINQEE